MVLPLLVMAEGLMVDGEKCDIVDSFCYLSDILSTKGRADAAVSARVKRSWKKLCELALFLLFKTP